jgi:hypothetical protein
MPEYSRPLSEWMTTYCVGIAIQWSLLCCARRCTRVELIESSSLVDSSHVVQWARNRLAVWLESYNTFRHAGLALHTAAQRVSDGDTRAFDSLYITLTSQFDVRNTLYGRFLRSPHVHSLALICDWQATFQNMKQKHSPLLFHSDRCGNSEEEDLKKKKPLTDHDVLLLCCHRSRSWKLIATRLRKDFGTRHGCPTTMGELLLSRRFVPISWL